MPNFESFHKHLVPLRGDPQVTIQMRGAMSLNNAAYRLLGSPKAVELLYDRAALIVGLRPAEAEVDNAYPVRPATRANGPFVISAMAFTHYYELDTKVSRRWPAYLDDGVLCIDLSRSDGRAVTSNRARRLH